MKNKITHSYFMVTSIMGIQERKEREKGERKALIMRCAKDLILKQGVEQVSMGDIAESAELSKGTLYLYFPSKEELFKAICDEAARHFIAYFQSRLGSGLSALEKIKLFWNCYLDLYGQSDDIIIIFSMKNYLAPAFPFVQAEEAASFQANLVPYASIHASDSFFMFCSMIKDMICQGIEEGTFDLDSDPDMIARTILCLFSYIMENAAKIPKAARKSQMIIEEMQHIFEIFLRGTAREGFDRSLLVLPGPDAAKHVQ